MSSFFRFGLPTALLALASSIHPAFAQVTQTYSTNIVNPFYANVTSFDTTTSTSSPTFNRPGLANVPGVTAPPTALSGGGTAVGYAAKDFTPDSDGTYQVTTTINSGYANAATSASGTDNFVQAIYIPTATGSGFNPASPLTNAGLAYSQGTSGDSYSVGLAGGTAYTFVNTGYYNSTFTGSKLSVGSVTTSIDKYNLGSTMNIASGDILGNTTTETETLSLVGGSPITAFNNVVIAGLTDTAAGNLTATLSHNGLTATLFDQPANGDFGGTDSLDASQTYSFADFGSDLPTALNDAAASAPGFGTATLGSGTFKSLDSLSVFDGAALAGDWTLSITDNGVASTGSFLGFTFSASSASPAALPVPEASTWVSMGLGCLTLGFLVRRRIVRTA